jgi:hypothetical protein
VVEPQLEYLPYEPPAATADPEPPPLPADTASVESAPLPAQAAAASDEEVPLPPCTPVAVVESGLISTDRVTATPASGAEKPGDEKPATARDLPPGTAAPSARARSE